MSPHDAKGAVHVFERQQFIALRDIDPARADDADGCKCQGCGATYRGDLQVPDDVWAAISHGCNLLCAACIAGRIINAGIWTAIRGEDIDAQPSAVGREIWVYEAVPYGCGAGHGGCTAFWAHTRPFEAGRLYREVLASPPASLPDKESERLADVWLGQQEGDGLTHSNFDIVKRAFLAGLDARRLPDKSADAPCDEMFKDQAALQVFTEKVQIQPGRGKRGAPCLPHVERFRNIGCRTRIASDIRS